MNFSPISTAQFPLRAGVTAPDTRKYGDDVRIFKGAIEGDRAPLAETYMLDADGDYYGKEASVELLHMSRPEQRFSGVGELKETVLRDITFRRAESE